MALEATFAFSGDDEGVIYARGNENAGITIFIQNAHVVVDYNVLKEHSIWNHPFNCRQAKMNSLSWCNGWSRGWVASKSQ